MRWLMLGVLALIVVAGGVILGRDSGSVETPPAPAPVHPFDTEKDDFVLDEAVQKYVFDIETRAHYLQMDFVPELIKVIGAGNEERWLSFAAREFSGSVPGDDRTVERCGPVEVTSWMGKHPRRVDARGFFRYVAGKYAAGLTELEVHIEQLAPVERDAFDGPWTGTWSLALRTPVGSAPSKECVLMLRIAYARVDEYPARDQHWIVGIETIRETQLACAQGPLFEDITARSGINDKLLWDTWNQTGPTTFFGTYLLDYDRDGLLDLFLIDETKSLLYRGLGDGRFDDVTVDAHLLGPAGGRFTAATVADLDNDGYEDLLLDVETRGGRHPVIYRNEGDGSFRALAPDEMEIPHVLVGNASVADFDGDGLVDIYLPNSGAGVSRATELARWIGDRTGFEGLLLKNLGAFRFKDITEQANARGGNREVFGSIWTDVDLDGDPDLVLVNHMGENALLENRGDGTFRERPLTDGFGGFSMGLTVGDLDEDGDPDLYVANMASRAGQRIVGNLRETDYPAGVYSLLRGFVNGDEVYTNTGVSETGTGSGETGTGFEVVAARATGWAYGPAMVDFDGDGRLDVYCPAGYQSVNPGEPDG